MSLKNLLKRIFGAKQKSKFISATVPSNDTEKESFTVNRDSKIKKIEARFYPGQQLDLELEPYLKKADSDAQINLVDYPGDKKHLEGDDDVVELPTNVVAEKNDEVEVKAVNQDTSGNAYDFYLIVTMEEDV